MPHGLQIPAYLMNIMMNMQTVYREKITLCLFITIYNIQVT